VTEWTSSLHPTLSCVPIWRHVRFSSIWHDTVQCIHPVQEDHFTETEAQPVQASKSRWVSVWTDNAGIHKMRWTSSWYTNLASGSSLIPLSTVYTPKSCKGQPIKAA
jgi:hypothetical protein